MKRWPMFVLAIEVLGIVVFSLAYDSLEFRIYWLGGQAVTDGTRLYEEQLAAHWFTNTPFVGVPYISNQSPLGALTCILRGTAEIGAWYTAIPLAIGAIGLSIAVAWARRGDWLTAIAVTGVTGLLVSPISWAHHWVWIVPALAVLIRNNSRTIAACGYALFAVELMWSVPYNDHPLRFGWHLLLVPAI